MPDYSMFTAEEIARLDAMSLEDKLKFYAERKKQIASERPEESVPPAVMAVDRSVITKVAEINQRNKAFWANYCADFDALVERWRSALTSPEAVLALMEGQAASTDADVNYKFETIRRNSQAASRPRKKSDFKGAVVNAMRLFRSDGKSLEDFISAAANHSIKGLSIELTAPADHPHDRKYEVCTDDYDGCERSFCTLRSYWTAAGKK